MPSSHKETDGIPLIVFIPVIVCIVAILILLDFRQRQNHPEQYRKIDTTTMGCYYVTKMIFSIAPAATINTTTRAIRQPEEFVHESEEESEEESDDNHGEGSSTAVRVKKVGKKRGEKLRRKEQMRQYREYMDQQRELRRAQEEIYEEEFQRKKVEDSIKRTDEMEKRRKEKEKKAKQQEKEALKRIKNEEKDAKKRQTRFSKYSDKVRKMVKENKLCKTSDLARSIGLTQQVVGKKKRRVSTLYTYCIIFYRKWWIF
jgi:hypothetical protein